jgi:hypothetical protein
LTEIHRQHLAPPSKQQPPHEARPGPPPQSPSKSGSSCSPTPSVSSSTRSPDLLFWILTSSESPAHQAVGGPLHPPPPFHHLAPSYLLLPAKRRTAIWRKGGGDPCRRFRGFGEAEELTKDASCEGRMARRFASKKISEVVGTMIFFLYIF